MLEDDSVRLDRKLEHIAFLPIEALPIDDRVPRAFDRNDHRSSLTALFAAAAAGSDLLRLKDEEFVRGRIDLGMHVPFHHALRVDFPRKLAAFDAHAGGGDAPPLLVAPLDQLLVSGRFTGPL